MSEYNRENHHDDHHDDITRFRAERDAALAELAAQLAKNDRLREERRKGVAELAHLRVAVDRLRDDLDEQNAELAQMREEMTKEADEAARLREDNRNLWQKRNDLVQEVGDLRAENARLCEEKDNQETCEALDTHEAMEAEIDRLRATVEELQLAVRLKGKAVRDAQDAVARLRGELHDANVRVDWLREAMQENDALLSKAQVENARLREALKDIVRVDDISNGDPWEVAFGEAVDIAHNALKET